MRVLDQPRTEVAGDALVAVLARVERPVALVRDGEEAERRELRLVDVVGDGVVHLPVRQEPVDLVLGRGPGGPGRRLRRAGLGAVGGRRRVRAGRTGSHERQGRDQEDRDDAGADELSPGHPGSVGEVADPVKRPGRRPRLGVGGDRLGDRGFDRGVGGRLGGLSGGRLSGGAPQRQAPWLRARPAGAGRGPRSGPGACDRPRCGRGLPG